MKRSYFIVSLGCPKNQADSRELERSLQAKGLIPSPDDRSADVIVINSCAFTTEASEETIETVFDALRLRDENPGKEQRVVLAGCFSQRYREAVRTEIPELDLSFGTGRFGQAGSLIAPLFSGELLENQGADSNAQSKPGSLQTLTYPWAPLKISEGCDRKCTFCAIPSFRGPYMDLDPDSILDEAKKLADAGIREIDIVSQDTVQFGTASPEALFDLIERIGELSSIHWIRLLYLYPDQKLDGILDEWIKRKPRKLVSYLESPVQHVSSHVLKSMGRSGSMEFYNDLFTKAREGIEGLEIRTSFILGFPGETEQDIHLVQSFIEKNRIDRLSLFPYSREENTAAFDLGEPELDAQTRVNQVRDFQLQMIRPYRQSLIGRSIECMVDESGEEGILARRAQDAPEIDGAVLLPYSEKIQAGDVIRVKVTGAYEYDLEGELVQEETE